MLLAYFIVFLSFLIGQSTHCKTDNLGRNPSTYSIGDTLSEEDQNRVFSVCNGSGDYSIGDSFSFSDLNGNSNGGDYKITIISMNATW
tara:strand:- start:123 stop:386 length:264 start_codon:yes stop_codon:yes gene_type:complete